MRAHIIAMLGIGALGFVGACAGRTRTDAAPIAATTPSGPAGDPCAEYIERVTSGVRCEALDARRCQCELVADAEESAATPVVAAAPAETGQVPADSGKPPAPTASAGQATLEFAPGPPNTIVQCMRGPCPSRSADFITQPHAPLEVAAAGTEVELEFRSPGHQPYTSTYTLKPGRNYIQFSLQPATVGLPTEATLRFTEAPAGLKVACISGPCVDHKAYPAESFPPLPLQSDGVTTLFRFDAPGYRTANSSFQIRRGPNEVPVMMERAPLGK